MKTILPMEFGNPKFTHNVKFVAHIELSETPANLVDPTVAGSLSNPMKDITSIKLKIQANFASLREGYTDATGALLTDEQF